MSAHDWVADQEMALAELLDPPLHSPLFPVFPEGKAVPYVELEPGDRVQVVGWSTGIVTGVISAPWGTLGSYTITVGADDLEVS